MKQDAHGIEGQKIIQVVRSERNLVFKCGLPRCDVGGPASSTFTDIRAVTTRCHNTDGHILKNSVP
jgi:hypothetical protein